MNEQLFGATTPLWPSLPLTSPGFFGLGNRTMNPTGAFTAPQVPTGILSAATNITSVPRPSQSQFPQMPVPEVYGFGLSGLLPVAIPQDVTMYTVPALLSAIAMRRGQPLGPTNDQEIEDFIYDALEVLGVGTSEVDVRLESGRATLTGSVPHRRLKRDAGEIAWAIPSISDVQNNITITTRRRPRTSARENEQPSVPQARKQA